MSSNYSSLPFEWNEDLWFDDGDIRICARRFDSGALCLYKLYRDMLAVHSTTLVRLVDKALTYRHIYVGNTPYAYLTDEDALDLERFFIAIYYPTYMFFWKHNSRSFRRALPIFRIALKYKANSVIEALSSQLEEDWPQTITEWDASQCEDYFSVEPLGNIGSENQASSQPAAIVTEPASAIQVARIANIPTVLNAAYYQLSRISSDILRQNIVLPASTTRDYSHRARQTLLSKEDLRRLACGKEKLADYMLSFKKHLPQELKLHSECAAAWSTGTVGGTQSVDPLADLLEVCSVEAFPDGNVCSDCRLLVNERGREERARIWAHLPQLFSLPST